MIAALTERNWQSDFVTMLPELERRLRRAFRLLDPAARDEATAEAIALCALAFARLHNRGRTRVATPSTLAYYTSRQVKCGRTAASRMNCKEPLSRYAQVGCGIRVERLQSHCDKQNQWIDALVEDRKASVPDQVAARIDVRAWLATLPQRLTQIAKDLAHGWSTSDVASKYGVSRARISQLRRKLEQSWADFQHEDALAAAE